MGLTYNIRFKTNIEEKKQFKELQKNNKNEILLISDLHTTDRFYLDSLFEGYTIELDLGTVSFINFDVLKKGEDPYKMKSLLLELVDEIVNNIYPEEDYYFSFNGDIIYEMRENGVVKRNSKTDFYRGLE